MTQLSDLELSERLAVLRVSPPDHGFRERLLGNLRALEVAPEPRARVLRLRLRQRPVALLALGALGFAGAAAAALDGHVWQALRAIATPQLAPPEATPTVAVRQHAQRATAKPGSPAAAPAAATNPAGASDPAALVQPAPATAPAASTSPAVPATGPAAPRSGSEARAGHSATATHASGRERRSLQAEHEPPSTRGTSPEPAHLAVPRVDLTDLPSEHAAHDDGPRSPGERSRDARDDLDAAHGARDRAAEAREHAADHRPSDRARRIDAPLLDIDHERKAPDARERDDHDRDSHGDRARRERDR